MVEDPLNNPVQEQIATPTGIANRLTPEKMIRNAATVVSSTLKGAERLWRNFKSNESYVSTAIAMTGMLAEVLILSHPELPFHQAYVNWGHDAVSPLSLYFLVRGNLQTKRFSPKLAYGLSGAIFVAATTLEFGQRVGIYPGTYDPYDFAAYAVGCGLAVALDKISFGKPRVG